MTPRLTTTWKNRSQQVVDYITANPGCTGKEISYKTGVALSTVHRIIQHDPRAFQLAVSGKVAVLDRHMKPLWYHESMKLVPLVKRDRIDPKADLMNLVSDNRLDPKASRVLGRVIDMVAAGIATPGRSVLARKKSAVAIVSETQLLGIGYTEVKTENERVIPRLASLEKAVLQLTARESLEKRYGSTQLRKTARS
jgi:hypothetical protein